MEQTLIPTDTIAAIATPHGTGAIAILRLSGPQAIDIVSQCWQGFSLRNATSHTVHLGHISDLQGNPIDEVLLTIMRAPRTYTGEDTIEISCHGSRWIQQAILNRLLQCGARAADPGEYTRRAFLNGRIDLTKAEAIADLISTSSAAAARIAMHQMKGALRDDIESIRQQLLHIASLLELQLDFSEEDLEFASTAELLTLLTTTRDQLARIHSTFARGAAIKDGIPVAIIGQANAGKSSLLNTLLHDDKAIVSDIPGTTRDTIEDTIEIGDYLFRFIDTAGLRHTTDSIEQIGIDRAITAARHASILLHIIDATTLPLDHHVSLQLPHDLTTGLPPHAQIITILNKIDLLTDPQVIAATYPQAIPLSTKTHQGLSTLTQTLTQTINSTSTSTPLTETTSIIITNARQAQALSQALDEAQATIHALTAGLTPDITAQHLRALIHHLATITGAITTPEILQSIFTRFCVGK